MKNLTALGLVLATAVAFGVGPAEAREGKSPWQIGLRILAVVPDEEADVTVAGIDGGDVDIENSIVPELDITYFFTKNIALELIAAVTPHDVEAKDTVAGDVDLGDVWLLPPTLILQYHFTPDNTFSPYAGAGINYTHFFNEDAPDGVDIEYDDSVGLALQVGFDYKINERFAFNFDVKKVWIQTDVDIDVGGTPASAEVDIDPWIVGIGFNWRY